VAMLATIVVCERCSFNAGSMHALQRQQCLHQQPIMFIVQLTDSASRRSQYGRRALAQAE